MTHIIHILTVSGSPRGIIPEDIYGRGVGGAEKALIQLSQELVRRGYHVTIYNDPREIIDQGSLQFKPFRDFVVNDPNRILISFRGPHEFTNPHPKAVKHIGWSCDQYTAGDYATWYGMVDQMVLISPYHKLDHIMRNYIDDERKIIITDLGILASEYSELNINDKVPYQVIHCSQPDRGLNHLAEYWDDLLNRIPELQLHIFGGFSLWNGWNDLDSHFRIKWAGKRRVNYHGKVSRHELIQFQKSSEAMLYPCIFPELFNISTAECLSAGNQCITSNAGAVQTTNFSSGLVTGMPTDIAFKGAFTEKVDEFFTLSLEERRKIQLNNHRKALARFSWETVGAFWEKEILNV